MSQSEQQIVPLSEIQLQELTNKVNSALKYYSDKDWNYSRISLQLRPLTEVDAPYLLWFELMDTRAKQTKQNLKIVVDEITWGDRHSNELGILELISLRLNKALLEVTSDDYWLGMRPVIRLVRKELLADTNVTHALWYIVHEVSGEEFENR